MGAYYSLELLHTINGNNNKLMKNTNNSNSKMSSTKVFAITDSEASNPSTVNQQELAHPNPNHPPPPPSVDANTSAYDNQPRNPPDPPPGYYTPPQAYPPAGYAPPQGYPPQGYPPASNYPPAVYYTPSGQPQYYASGGAYPGQNVVYYVPVQGAPPPEVYVVQKIEDPRERSAFIQKVYSILFLQLACCFSFVAMCTFVPEMKEWVAKNYILIYLFLFLYLACAIVMCCCSQVLMTTNAGSVTLLIVLTLALSGMCGFISSRAGGMAVIMALAATMVAVLVLTLIAFQSKYDFTKWMGAMLVIFIIFILFGFFAIFLSPYIPFLHLIYSFLGAILMCVYIVIDTQMLLSGKRYTLDTEMYIFAAVMLFVDIVLLFLYILDIVQQLDG